MKDIYLTRIRKTFHYLTLLVVLFGITLHVQAASLKTVVRGVGITVSADEDVLPPGTRLTARLLTDTEKEGYLAGLQSDRGVILKQSLAFDITLKDKKGKEIQPSGEVEVSFSGVNLGGEPGEMVVFHAVNGGKKAPGSFAYDKKFPVRNPSGKLKSGSIPAKTERGHLEFSTSHFSVYLVGTVNTATYNFYVGPTLEETQIVLNGESLLEPPTPALQVGKRFTGWFIGSTPVVFNTPVSVPSTATYTVNAKYEDIYYVYFVYSEKVATKEVTPGGTTDATGIPLMVTEAGKAFLHWSATDGGPAFNFSSPITANITLYAVLGDLWTVKFDSQGGTTTLPKYIANGQPLGTVTAPTRPGFAFSSWNTAANGSGTTYTSATNITASVTLYAIWTANTNTPYTVVYWQENANDNNYSYYQTLNRTGITGTDASYAPQTYTGFTLNTALTNAAAVNIAGDGTTIRFVYYQRLKYTLVFLKDNQTGTDPTLFTFPNIKYGEDTSSEWNTASTANPTYLWATTNWGNTYYSAPPAMPNSNLTVWGRALGTTAYEIYYYETGTTNSVKPKFTFSGSSGMNITEAEDAIAIPGFTYSGTYTNFNSETPKKAYIYYNRNSYIITFNKNDGTGAVSSPSIPYQADISGQALAGYVEDNPATPNVNEATVRSDGYTFGGWYAENLGVNKFIFAGQTMPANNLILYGKWIPPVYTVRIHKVLENPGPSDDSYVILLAKGATIDESSLVKENVPGVAFIGWFWYVGNQFVRYDFLLPVTVDAIELFPVWSIKTYNVTYVLNGGTGPIPSDPNNYYLGSYAIVLPPAGVTPPTTGKVFVGWARNGNVYYPNEKALITGTNTLTAQWGDIPAETTLTYFPNGGTGTNFTISNLENNATVTVLSNSNVSLGYTRTGYLFAGWNTQADGSGDWFNAENSIVVGKADVLAPNQLYAQWAKISIVKTGLFNDVNDDGVAQAGETISYTFAVKNEGFIPLTDVAVSDSKVTPSPASVAQLSIGATTTFTGTYTLTAADITSGQVTNTATVTGYTPSLNLPVSATDNETVLFEVCSLEITCPANIVDVPNTAGLCSASVSFAATATGSPTPVISYAIGAAAITSPHVFPVGTTTVMATATNGCKTVTCTFTVNVDDTQKPVITLLGDATVYICQGGTYTDMGATALDNCDGTLTPTVSSTVNTAIAGTYTVKYNVTDGSGNPADQVTRTVIVNATPAVPLLSAVTQPTCTSATGSFTITNYNASYTYAAIPSTGVVITGSAVTAPAGSYTLTATLGTCTSAASSRVTVNAQPATPAAPVVGTITQPACAVKTGSVVLSGLPAGDWTINPGEITGSTVSTTIANLAPGTYNFTVTNSVGCTSSPSANVVINPQPDITPNITVSPNIIHGVSGFATLVKVTELNQVNTAGLITILIPKDNRWTFTYDPALTMIGTTPVNNGLWSYSATANPDYHTFTTTEVIPAGTFVTFGFQAIFDPANSRGIATITSQIVSCSGGENLLNNNADSEKLEYFVN